MLLSGTVTNFLRPVLKDMDLDRMFFRQQSATVPESTETMALLLQTKFAGRTIYCVRKKKGLRLWKVYTLLNAERNVSANPRRDT